MLVARLPRVVIALPLLPVGQLTALGATVFGSDVFRGFRGFVARK
jgi:hypothetical protein